jgi:lipoprotein signal peptidase
MWKRLAMLALIATTVGCDRVTKHFAEETLAGTPRQSFLADTVRLEYVENAGAFLALGADWPPAVRVALFTYGSGLLMLGVGLLVVALYRAAPASCQT